MNRHCIPGLTMSTALTGNFCRGVGIIKNVTWGFNVTCIVLCQHQCWHGRNDCNLAWKICVVFWMLSVNSNELSVMVISFMFVDICNPSENSCFSKDFPCIAKMWFLLILTIIGRFYKMRISWEFNIFTTFLSPFINTVLSFSNTMWILSVAR